MLCNISAHFRHLSTLPFYLMLVRGPLRNLNPSCFSVSLNMSFGCSYNSVMMSIRHISFSIATSRATHSRAPVRQAQPCRRCRLVLTCVAIVPTLHHTLGTLYRCSETAHIICAVKASFLSDFICKRFRAVLKYEIRFCPRILCQNKLFMKR